jgi:tripartite-type tricarboxylate transporter receptor subunit TctC
MKIITRLTLALGLTLSVVGLAHAQEWPNKSIKLISPFPAGGSNDIATRMIGERLAIRLKQSVVVENKPGANTRIASTFIAKADPDGYTFMMAAAPHTTNPALFGQLPYDTLKDFTPIVQVVRAPLFLLVPAASPIQSTQQLLAMAATQQAVNISSPGNGTGPHLALELLNFLAKSNLTHVPYKGDAPAMTDLVGGQLTGGIHPIVAPLPFIKSERLRALAVFGSQRSALLPNVPSLGEQGFKDTDVYTWFGMVGPAKLPAPIVTRMNKEINEILALPEVKERFVAIGMETVGGTPAQFSDYIQTDINKWNALVKVRKIKAD